MKKLLLFLILCISMDFEKSIALVQIQPHPYSSISMDGISIYEYEPSIYSEYGMTIITLFIVLFILPSIILYNIKGRVIGRKGCKNIIALILRIISIIAMIIYIFIIGIILNIAITNNYSIF